MGRGDLSDEQWSVLEPLLPVVGLGRRSRNRRRLIDGVRWRVRTGVPWRDLPCEYGPWQTVYGLFRRWQREGVWAPVLLTSLQARADAAGLITWEVNVDSTVCRAHQNLCLNLSCCSSLWRSAQWSTSMCHCAGRDAYVAGESRRRL
ncbi:transposase [Streptomyces sp. R33]|uniref:Transposase n=1 Tax=Streptomyces sp. R33 TaxID=3238629 RepID=A0AB39XWD9_9ACTN